MTSPDPAARRPPVPGPLGRLLALAYGAGIAHRNRRFDAGAGVHRLELPVISVGNLSVGGTGKTPMVMHLARALGAAGVRPCIAMRGYRAGPRGSDEAAEYARHLPDVPVIARPDRLEALREYLTPQRRRGIDAVLLDDGFQHRRLHRDLDIVLLDATADPCADRLLPAGWLREPLESLGRAHAAVVTHAEDAAPGWTESIIARARQVNPRLVVAVARHVWHGVVVRESGADREEPLGFLTGRLAVATCAIGNPGSFLKEAERRIGGPLGARVVRRDHDPFGPGTIRSIIGVARSIGADLILTTEKDWSKLAAVPSADWPCPVARPRLALAFDLGEEALLEAARRAAGSAPSTRAD